MRLLIAALSQTSPARLMLHAMRCSLSTCLELFADVLATSVRVVHQRHRFTLTPHRHHQSVGDQLRDHAVVHGAAHRALQGRA